MQTHRYAYRPKAWVMALSGLFFAGCAAILGKVALDNDRGLILNGIIRLDPGQATLFYWALVVVSVLFVLAALFGLVRSMGTPDEVVLDRVGITAPRGLGRRPVSVPYDRITDLKMQQIKSQKLLTLHHRDGKLTLSRSMLPSNDDFEEIVALLVERCRAIRP